VIGTISDKKPPVNFPSGIKPPPNFQIPPKFTIPPNFTPPKIPSTLPKTPPAVNNIP
jgi:hypothetical protein